MVRRLVWTVRAKADLRDILSYWKQRNKSNVYSKKLRKTLLIAAEILLTHPYSGAVIKSNMRKKPVKDYLIAYEIREDSVIILSIFDTRQHPDKLNTII